MNLKRVITGVLTLALAVSVGCSTRALANGNTTADAPDPAAKTQTRASTKTVRKATVKKAPVKKAPAKAAKAPAPARQQQKQESSLDKGIALAQQERYQAALPWLQKAVQENPKSAAAWYWYGKCHEQTGQFYQAQYFYSRALNVDPMFDPLSRVVVYPDDPNGKIPLWDPKRPARVYPVPTQQPNGTYIMPPDAPQSVTAKLPSRPDRDPELPKVPSYAPPQPGAMGESGPDQPWQPAIYVPPSRIDTIGEGDENAIYMPPEAPRVTYIPDTKQASTAQATQDLSGFQNLVPAAPSYQAPTLGDANAKIYQPPEPPAQSKASAKAPAKTPVKKAPVKKAPRKTVTKKTGSKPASQSTSKTIAPDNDEPRLPVIPAAEATAPVKQPEQKPVQQPRQNSEEYLPPVGQRPNGNGNNRSAPPVSR